MRDDGLEGAKEAWREEYRVQRELRAAPWMETLARLKAKHDAMTPEERDRESAEAVAREAARAEKARIEHRAARLRAAVKEPERGTPQYDAWVRVVRARSAKEAAAPGHEGSLAAMEGVASWLATPRRSTLVLAGPVGRGKTCAAWFALAEHGGVLVAPVDVKPIPSWDALHRAARGASLLVVNDVTERLKGWAAEQLAEIIEERHDEGLRTLITTNQQRPALAAILGGDRMASRLAQSTIGNVVGGPDLRARSA